MPLLRAASKEGATYKTLRGVPSTANPLPSHSWARPPVRIPRAAQRGGVGEAAREAAQKAPWQLITSRMAGILGEERAELGARATARSGAPPLRLRDRRSRGVRRSRPRTPRDSAGGCPGAAPAPARPAGAVRPRVRRAAGRVSPVHLEHERAAVCARQRGHGAPVAGRPSGLRGADGWGPGRRRAAAEHAERDASLICQSWLETSAFPPSGLKSP